MNGFPQSNEPPEMTLTFLLLYAAACILSEMKSLRGFGFQPDNEDIIDYLKKKRRDPRFSMHMITEIDLYSCEPWDLPGMPSKKPVYFFSEPYYYPNSTRAHRRTKEGYWKVTGPGSKVMAENSPDAIGRKRILPFYYRGSKTEWVMHEFYVEDNPLYKKDFVLCRIERKRDNKHGISTNDEGRSNQQLVSYSGNQITENTISEAVQQPSNNLISNRNYVTENIFSKTGLPPSDPLISYSRNQAEEITLLDSQQLSSDHLISSSRNHVAENGFAESQLLPSYNLISCSRNQVAENACEESQVLANHNMISDSRYHVAENSSAELLPNHNMIPYFGNRIAECGTPESLLLPNHNMIPYSGNDIVENGTPESQLLPNDNVISYHENHVAENGSPESQLPPNHNMISYSRNYVAENVCVESQQQLPHNLISYSRNHVAENASLESQSLANHNMISCSSNHIAENASLELQPANHNVISRNMISCSGNHVAENASPELQPDNHNMISRNMISCSRNHIAENASLQSQKLLPNQHLDFYSINNIIENTSHKLLPEFNAGSGYNGLNNASYPALQSPIYSEQGSSYSNCSNNSDDLFNSQFGGRQVDFLTNSQRAFQNANPCEETRQTPIPHFNSSKPDEGVYVEDSGDMDIDEWVIELSEILFD